MAAPLESSVVRIYSKSGKVVGAGFLVSSKHVLTCAHVVTDALGIPRTTQEQPDGVINLDFPLLAAKQLFVAKVIFWQAVNPHKEFEDIAGLELETALPETAQPSQLVTSEDLWGHPFRVLGFPAGQPNGVSASGVLRGRIANGWVQLEDVKQPGYRLEPGFSGAPVWDEELQGVAGMAVAAEMNRADVKAAFIIPTSILVNAWSDLGEQAIPSCPYRGLFAFREQDAKFFFGRETFTEQLVAAVQRQPLVAVIGSSGSGKSSVVFAGFVPQLRQQGDWLINSFRLGERPFRNLATALVPLLETQMSETDQLAEINKLAKTLRLGDVALQDVVTRILEKNSSTRLLLVADQFEELYTLCRDVEERQGFLERFLEAVNILNFTVVLTLRADFLGYALSYRPFADALQNADVKLAPMNRQELRDVIAKPAQLLGVRIESGLTERILEAVEKEPGNLPLLEFALTLLWAKQRNGQLTHQAYEDIGGVEKALAGYAEAVYSRLSGVDRQVAQRVFVQLVCPGEGTEDTRRLATRDEVGEDKWDLVRCLADARLVVTGWDEGAGKETVEIVHEALILEWGRLRGWMESDRTFRTWQERLRVARRQWEVTSKDEGALLRGFLLEEASKWQQQRLAELSLADQDFIDLSVALQKREQAEIKAQELAQLEAQIALETERQANEATKQANQILADARQEAKRRPLKQQIWSTKEILLAALSVAGFIVILRFAGLLQSGEWAMLDQFFRWRPAEPPEKRILIVGINESDIDYVGHWPLSDAVLAQMLEKLKAREPRAIGLQLYRNLPVQPGTQALEKVYKSTPNLIGIEKKVADSKSTPVAPPPVLKQLEQVGANDVVPDADGKFRRGLLFLTPKSEPPLASLGLRLALIYLERQGITPSADANDFMKLGKTVFVPFEENDGGYVRADAGGYQILLNFKGANPFQTVSMRDVLEDRLPASMVRDRIVLIGAVAPSLNDFLYTPYILDPRGLPTTMPGIEFQAHQTATILSAALEGRPLIQTWSEPLEVLWIFLWSGFGALLIWLFYSPRILALTILLAGTGLIGSCYLAFLIGWWLPLIPSLLALGGAATLTLVVTSHQLEKHQLRRTLELIMEAYRENPIAGRIAIEYLKRSENQRNQNLINQWQQEIQPGSSVDVKAEREEHSEKK